MSSKISQLTPTVTLDDTSEIPLALSGNNFKITGANLKKAIANKVGKTIFVDATFGSDVSGAANDIAKPFQSITAAQGVATAGDLIYINAGEYKEENLGKTGVSYYFAPNSILDSNNSCFRDNGNSLTFNVFGSGKFISRALSVSSGICYLTGSSSSVYFEGIDATGTDRAFWVNSGARLVVNIKDYIVTTNEAACRVDTHASNVSYLNVTASRILSDVICLQTKNSLANGTLIVNCPYIEVGSSNYTFLEQLGGNVLINGNCYQATAGSLPMFSVGTGSVTMKLKGEAYNTSASNFAACSAGIADFYGKIYTAGRIVPTGGTINLYDYVEGNVTNLEVINVVSGTCRVFNRIKNLQNNANAHGVVVQGGNLVLDGASIVVTNASANSVYAATAQNIKVYSAVANYAANVNITNTITGTSIIVDTDVI